MAKIDLGKVKPDITNDLNAKLSGTALDATQGKALNDKITELDKNLAINTTTITKIHSSSAAYVSDGLCTVKKSGANICVYGYLNWAKTAFIGRMALFQLPHKPDESFDFSASIGFTGGTCGMVDKDGILWIYCNNVGTSPVKFNFGYMM